MYYKCYRNCSTHKITHDNSGFVLFNFFSQASTQTDAGACCADAPCNILNCTLQENGSMFETAVQCSHVPVPPKKLVTKPLEPSTRSQQLQARGFQGYESVASQESEALKGSVRSFGCKLRSPADAVNTGIVGICDCSVLRNTGFLFVT